jgi:hypothetical protein
MDRQRILDDLTALGRSLFRDMKYDGCVILDTMNALERSLFRFKKEDEYARTYDAVTDMVDAFNEAFPNNPVDVYYADELWVTRNQL